MEWTYDKQLHLVAGGAAGYVMSDVLERTTGLNAWQRFLVTTATVTVAAYAHEELIGVRDPEDAQASTLGGILGAGGQLGASLILSEKQASLSVAWSF